jgi:hypothetical protein
VTRYGSVVAPVRISTTDWAATRGSTSEE